MNILTKEEFFKERRKYQNMIKKGAVFIYPTDTIYGLGCDATNKTAVRKIRQLKARPDNPLSIIPPSKEWIEENCEVFGQGIDWLEKLPGPYTLIFKLKEEESIAPEVNNNSETLGVRIPDTWISAVVKELDLPLVTTSVNEAGKPYMTSLEDIEEKIKNSVDFIIYEGKKESKPSTVINLIDGEVVVER
ncbi:threonylcarbamoyl-AMP synthase [Candidatus Woesearchaeota archaeon]|nr:threonylcarbamoyl-AMP synthase [Candidatus Woesearchaeota archaeon]